LRGRKGRAGERERGGAASMKERERKKIKQDIRKFEEEKTEEIIENSWSTRRVKREIQRERKIINRMKDEEGISRTGKKM
jgi:hypothetical protein